MLLHRKNDRREASQSLRSARRRPLLSMPEQEARIDQDARERLLDAGFEAALGMATLIELHDDREILEPLRRRGMPGWPHRPGCVLRTGALFAIAIAAGS